MFVVGQPISWWVNENLGFLLRSYCYCYHSYCLNRTLNIEHIFVKH